MKEVKAWAAGKIHTFNLKKVDQVRGRKSGPVDLRLVEWGNYWIDFIRARAEEKGKEIYITDIYDSFYKVNQCEKCLEMIAKPEY